jgi:hypothetical protein
VEKIIWKEKMKQWEVAKNLLENKICKNCKSAILVRTERLDYKFAYCVKDVRPENNTCEKWRERPVYEFFGA